MNTPAPPTLTSCLAAFWDRMRAQEAAKIEAQRAWAAEQLRAVSDPLAPRNLLYEGRPLLHVLVKVGDEPGLREALEQGCRPGESDDKGVTALHIAAEEDQSGMVQALLSCGACLTVADHEGKTPLHWAAQSVHGKTIDPLIEAGAPLEAKTRNGSTPTFVAAGGHPDALRQLLQRGADPNATNDAGDTPLSQALMRGCLESVEALLEHGCDVDQPEGGNWTPLQLAINRDQRRAFERLLEHGAQRTQRHADPTPLFHMLAIHDRMDWAPFLLQEGFDPEEEDGQGRTLEQYLQEFNEHNLLAQWKQALLHHRLPAAGDSMPSRF